MEVSNNWFKWNERQVAQPVLRLILFASVWWLIAFLGNFEANAFIYFQF
jgi:hypothetical protein